MSFTKLEFDLNGAFGVPAANFRKAIAAAEFAQSRVHVCRHRLPKKPEHGEQSGFPRTIRSNDNGKAGNIPHLYITEGAEIFKRNLLNLHILTVNDI